MLYRLERSKMIIYEIDWRVMPYKLERNKECTLRVISQTRIAWSTMLNRTKGQLKSRTFLGPNCLDQKRAHDWPSKENSLEVTPVDSESLKVRPHWKHQMKTVRDGKPASTSKERSKPKSETGTLVDVQENGVGHPRV